MASIVTRLQEAIAGLQAEIEKEIDARRLDFKYRIEQRRVVFEKEVLEHHRLMRMKVMRFLRESKISAALTAPFIYIQIVPLVLMDGFATVYQQVCFRMYGIPRVRRGEHVVMDRKYLAYLNWIEKLNCVYCEYANGVISYVREIAGRTEQYWCPIKHASKVRQPHDQYYDFIEYGDADGFRTQLENQRERCRACESKGCSDKKQ